jgi:hypothetical protein
MAAAVRFREKFDGSSLRIFAKATKDAAQIRRLLALAGIVESGPIPAIYGVVRWRLMDLAQWLQEKFAVSLSETTVSRELRALGFRRLTARPRHHAQNKYALEAYKKVPRGTGGAPGAPAGRHHNRDVMAGPRIDLKNRITRRWARRGTRPQSSARSAIQSAYIFGAICPAKGKGTGLILPRCNTAAMQLHLDEIAYQVDNGAHALVMLDKAGWHMTDRLVVPDNVTLLPLPP